MECGLIVEDQTKEEMNETSCNTSHGMACSPY